MTVFLEIDSQETGTDILRPVIEVLAGGGIVAGPTQTYYGLMALDDRSESLSRVAELKGRPKDSPFLLLLDDVSRVGRYTDIISPPARQLMQEFWPGPLTLLFRSRPGLDPRLVGPDGTVGLRVEGLAVIRSIVRELGRAVTGTSANPTGHPPARTAGDVSEYFGDRVDLILDSGSCPGGKASTVIDANQFPPKLIRDGAVPLPDLLAIVPDLIHDS